jgi:hypothetical protein
MDRPAKFHWEKEIIIRSTGNPFVYLFIYTHITQYVHLPCISNAGIQPTSNSVPHGGPTQWKSGFTHDSGNRIIIEAWDKGKKGKSKKDASKCASWPLPGLHDSFKH